MFLPSERPKFDVEGAAWPNRERSEFLRAAGLRWHVQRWPGPAPAEGDGAPPTVLLLHGTGAATHSWAGLAPLLAERAQVIAVDLPGHGFTDTPSWPSRLSLPGMAAALEALLGTLGARADYVIGHSAGAAIALRMTLDGRLAPRRLFGLNGALKPFRGLAGVVFPQLARLLFVNPLTPRLFAATALDRTRVARLIESTGSTPPEPIMDAYARLFQSPGHVAGALGMMAHWDLAALGREAPQLSAPLTLIVGDQDRTVPPEDAEAFAGRVEGAEILRAPGLGHLAHEEDPAAISRLLFDRMR